MAGSGGEGFPIGPPLSVRPCLSTPPCHRDPVGDALQNGCWASCRPWQRPSCARAGFRTHPDRRARHQVKVCEGLPDDPDRAAGTEPEGRRPSGPSRQGIASPGPQSIGPGHGRRSAPANLARCAGAGFDVRSAGDAWRQVTASKGIGPLAGWFGGAEPLQFPSGRTGRPEDLAAPPDRAAPQSSDSTSTSASAFAVLSPFSPFSALPR